MNDLTSDASFELDARRYRWLREHAIEASEAVDRDYGFTADTPVLVMTYISVFDDDRKGVDAAVDAAMEGKEP